MPMIQVIPKSNMIRRNIASNKPIFRALGWSSGRSFELMMDKKIMLSTPSTISRKVNVKRLIQTAPELKAGKAKRNMIKKCGSVWVLECLSRLKLLVWLNFEQDVWVFEWMWTQTPKHSKTQTRFKTARIRQSCEVRKRLAGRHIPGIKNSHGSFDHEVD